jgi:hypothetical protein
LMVKTYLNVVLCSLRAWVKGHTQPNVAYPRPCALGIKVTGPYETLAAAIGQQQPLDAAAASCVVDILLLQVNSISPTCGPLTCMLYESLCTNSIQAV